MLSQVILKSKALSTIPSRKLHEKILHLVRSCKTSSAKNIKTIESLDGLCEKCSIRIIAFNRYYSSNIPFNYCDHEIYKFEGPKELLNVYTAVAENIARFYNKS